ncbi:MAG TPA: hypothetical protein DCM08_11865 [Microscillaceae bacterium]|nr:hypothetical protein [Microscillaceae bacterium]
MQQFWDYIIVGQGIAGTVLAHTFRQAGLKVMVIDEAQPCNCSLAAVGLCNPITGRRHALTWKAEELFPAAKFFYQNLEKTLGIKFFKETTLFRPFHSIQAQNEFMTQASRKGTDEWIDYQADTATSQGIKPNFSGWTVRPVFQLDSEILLHSYRAHLTNEGCFRAEKLDIDALEVRQDGVMYKELSAKKMIFCEGFKATQNPYWAWLPIGAVKGEWLAIHSPELQLPYIYKNQFFIVPWGDATQHTFRVGSTYGWQPTDDLPTAEAYEALLQFAKSQLEVPFEVIGRGVGLRPTTPDRRPLVGWHPQFQTLGLFNGLGTKGFSLAPYFANKLYENAEKKRSLDVEVDPVRFWNHQQP